MLLVTDLKLNGASKIVPVNFVDRVHEEAKVHFAVAVAFCTQLDISRVAFGLIRIDLVRSHAAFRRDTIYHSTSDFRLLEPRDHLQVVWVRGIFDRANQLGQSLAKYFGIAPILHANDRSFRPNQEF